MKKFFLLLFCVAGLSSSYSSFGQTFTVTTDTIYANALGSTLTVFDSIYSASTTTPVTILWKVGSSNFPADWLACLGLCDNNTCFSNSSLTTPPNQLWNGTSAYSTYRSNPYPAMGLSSHMTFDLSMSCTGSTMGTYYITVLLTDSANSNSTKTITFVVTKQPAGVAPIPKPEDEIMLYPNPAHNEVNIVYGAAAGVKTIAIYNIIGKVMNVFRPIDNSSAQLATDNLPAGIYFIRLMDAQGAVVATRKFTRQ